jgi:hypothetical protein
MCFFRTFRTQNIYIVKFSYRNVLLLALQFLFLKPVTVVYAAGKEEAQGSDTHKLVLFDHKKEPSPQDWRYFLKLSTQSQELLWRSFVKKGVNLRDWSWAWRLGWIRACTGNQNKFCEQIFNDGLQDRALVVRAEAITALGRNYEKTEREEIVRKIALAAADKRNFRNKRPMYISQRAIFSLHNVGGEKALKEASKIARTDPVLEVYFKKIYGIR